MSSQSEVRIADLAGELAKSLDGLEGARLDRDEVRDLLEGLATMASAVTRLLDDLRACPALRTREHELGLLAYQTIHSKLEQSAAAAEDLAVGAEALCRLLPHTP
ncbi:hypothetical protein GCM10027445_27560 [Amycolatopsis endophytica]|uniref:Uncharacterized protein n=1 Tax=Amycolatopsis endophytica TaxID=860233 RepID=A0A853B5Q7_9PSEU|nr:hypothetical protein [Amycolatopsis endophytica]NYI90330.1 hypothetical protein [Amycolatopsis endophytica]